MRPPEKTFGYLTGLHAEVGWFGHNSCLQHNIRCAVQSAVRLRDTGESACTMPSLHRRPAEQYLRQAC